MNARRSEWRSRQARMRMPPGPESRGALPVATRIASHRLVGRGRGRQRGHVASRARAIGWPGGWTPRPGPQAARARLEAASRWRVLNEKWAANLAELRKDRVPFDLVVFTGDLGDWGHPTDYPRAVTFLRDTCAALDVPLDRLFVIPGNHDIDRTIQRDAWESLRRDVAADRDAFRISRYRRVAGRMALSCGRAETTRMARSIRAMARRTTPLTGVVRRP